MRPNLNPIISSSVRFPCYSGTFTAKKGLTTTGFLHPGQYLERFRSLKSGFTDHEVKLLETVFSLAWRAHAGIVRFNLSDPYIVHLLGAAENLKQYGLGCVEISACLLHDIIEDGKIEGRPITEALLREELKDFATPDIYRIIFIIKGVTELGKEPEFLGEKPSLLEIHKKFLEYGSRDLTVVIVKILGDRLDNMRTLDYMSPEKQRVKAEETLRLYVPLADALGMWDLKRELEDLAFKYLEPEIYIRIFEKRREIIQKTEASLEERVKFTKDGLEQLGIPIQINRETRGVYEIYERTQRRKNITIENLSFSDIWRIGVVVPAGTDLYLVIGRIHGLGFAPVDGEFHDFVNTPCLNGHRFLQTYIGTAEGNLLIQIRDQEMENAYHWGVLAKARDDREWYKEETLWLKSLRTAFQRAGNITAQEADEIIARHAAPIKITILGREYEVPFGSTLIEAIGVARPGSVLCLAGARIRGRLTADIFHELENGDSITELDIGDSIEPKLEWFSRINKASMAYQKLKEYFEAIPEEAAMSGARQIINERLREEKFDVFAEQLENNSLFNQFCVESGETDCRQMILKVGRGEIKANALISDFLSFYNTRKEEDKSTQEYGVLLKVTADKPGILGKITTRFGDFGFNIVYGKEGEDIVDGIPKIKLRLKINGDKAVSELQKTIINNILSPHGEVLPWGQPRKRGGKHRGKHPSRK